MTNNLRQYYKKKYDQLTHSREDQPVLNFLKSQPAPAANYLEVGSGTGRWPLFLKKIFPRLKITCLEISPKLANLTVTQGLPTINADFLQNNLPADQYEIVHAAHLIEHFSYPEVRTVLEELLRLTKPGGYVIIRSPLLSPYFYLDIDHARPYPPECIINYFHNQQQQQTSAYQVELIDCWYRREALLIKRFYYSRHLSVLNDMLKILWCYLRWPAGTANGYVLIIQKQMP